MPAINFVIERNMTPAQAVKAFALHVRQHAENLSHTALTTAGGQNTIKEARFYEGKASGYATVANYIGRFEILGGN